MAREGRPTDRALVALILAVGAARPALAGAPGDSLLAAPAADSSAIAAAAAAWPPVPAGGFVLRRVANPRYRPPSPVPVVGPGSRAVRAGELAPHARFSRFDGQGQGSEDWEVGLARTMSEGATDELTATGTLGRWSGAHARVARPGWSAEAGDLRSETVAGGPVLERVRGAAYAGSEGRARWWVAGGVVPDLPRRPTPDLAIGTAAVSGVPLREASGAFAVVGFVREASRPDAFAIADSTAGGGAMVLASARAAGTAGVLTQTLGIQWHTLDGALRPAFLDHLDWTVERGPLVAAARSAIAGRGARQVFADRLLPAPEQMHSLSGRFHPGGSPFEVHAGSFLRSDFDLGDRSRSDQLGASLAPASGWRLDVGAGWLRGTAPSRAERMTTVQASRAAAAGLSFALRMDRNVARDAAAITQLGGEASGPAAHGLRASVEPRLRLVRGAAERAATTGRIGGLLENRRWGFWLSGTIAARRERRWRGELAQVEASLLWTPWRRARAGLDVRRYAEDDARGLEVVAAVDGRIPLREGDRAPAAGAGIEVRVTRSEDGRPVRDALVSVDGRRYGFTDADGVARIEGLEPGTHTVTLERRSLPAGYEIAGAPSSLIVVERQRAAATVRFEIVRPARTIRF